MAAPLLAADPPAGQSRGEGPSEYPVRLWLGVGTALLVLMVVFFAARVYTKWKIARKWTADDTTCTIAFLGTIAYYVIVTIMVVEGHFGSHLWTIPAADYQSQSFLIASWMASWLSAPVLLFLKATFFLLYLSIFAPSRPLRIAIYVGLVSSSIYFGTVTLLLIVVSTPKHGQSWEDAFIYSYSRPSANFGVGVTAPSIAYDLYILVLPIVGVMGLHLDRRKRLGVIVIFLTGIAACVTSALSLGYRAQRLINWKDEGGKSAVDDLTYTQYPVLITTYAEMPVGVICACMPAGAALWRNKGGRIKKLVDRWYDRNRAGTIGSGGSESAWYDESRIGRTYQRLEGGEVQRADGVRLGRMPEQPRQQQTMSA